MTRLPKTLAVLLLAPLAAATAAREAQGADRLEDRIARVMARPEFRSSFFGVEFVDLATGRTIYAHNAEKFFVPGSTTKLTTAGSALAALGPDHRFLTRVHRTGDIAADGTLEGDLVLVGSGDLNLSGRLREDGTLAFENKDHSYGGPPVPGDPLEVLRGLARQVASRGVKQVAGGVRIDVTLFPQGAREGGTGMVLSPVVVNDNIVDLTITPGATAGAPAMLRASPATPYTRFVNRVTTAAAGAATEEIAVASDVAAADGSRSVSVTGSVSGGAAPAPLPYGVLEPDRFAAFAFVEALRDAGVRASVAPRETRPTPRRAQPP